MMEITTTHVVVKKIIEPKKEGFNAVEPGDSFVYKGEVIRLPGDPVYISNKALALGDKVIFAKYSPDTFEVEDPAFGEEKVKFVKRQDILAVL